MPSENKTSDNTTLEYIEQLYREPVSAGTRRVGWFLTITSLLAISAVALDLQTSTTSVISLGISLSQDQFKMLSMLAVIGLLLTFLLYTMIDYFHKKEIDHVLTVKIHSQVTKWLKFKADELAAEPFRDDEDEQGFEDDFIVAMYSEHTAFLEKTEKLTRAQIDKIIHRRAALRLRNFRFWAAIIAPILLATISIWVGWGYLAMLGLAIGKSLTTQI